ncbi:ABC transporter substrate-binding protein [Candidatus Puniceispirillum sp.]|nr:ABC transporter substrate-binding protein [Candidatus Puniceispirillum sp.]
MPKNSFYHRICFIISGLYLAFTITPTNAGDFNDIQKAAKGKTVYFNAWGGDAKVNSYIAWAKKTLLDSYDVTLVHVKLTDTASAVSRILAEKAAGRTTGGSIDLLWVNGENFAAMKHAGLLQNQPWVTSLPNWRFTDSKTLPAIVSDFAEPTDGKESPWGRAQLVFSFDSARLQTPPKSASELANYIAKNPGRFTFPQPPDFIGMSFLKQILIELSGVNPSLYQPVSNADFDAVTEPLWTWLDAAKPNLWRSGRAYPANYPVLRQLLGDGEIDIAIAFNPADASAAIARGELPNTVRTYIHDIGTLANVHFLAIPFNASTPEAAKLVANFMLSPEAQVKKADTTVWGDPTVLAMPKLSDAQRIAFTELARGIATLSDADLGRTLAEPHPSWVPRLKAAWISRYASGN